MDSGRTRRKQPGTRARSERAVLPEGGSEAVYELLAPAYRMLASPARIDAEIEAIAPHLRGLGVRRILDAGCGSGFHAVELARRGWEVTGIDASRGMIRAARAHASREGVKARFLEGDLREASDLSGAPFDAVLCLGNTLSSGGSARARAEILRAFWRALRPAGVLIVQLRDLTRIPREGYAFPVRFHRAGDEEWILTRHQIPVKQGLLFLSTLLYRPRPDAAWEVRASRSIQTAVAESVWKESLRAAGFTRTRAASDLRGTPRRGKSPDLILFARRGP